MEQISKIYDLITMGQTEAIIKIVLLLGIVFFTFYMKRLMKKINRSEARKEEQNDQIKNQVEQNNQSGNINETIKQDGKKADDFLGGSDGKNGN